MPDFSLIAAINSFFFMCFSLNIDNNTILRDLIRKCKSANYPSIINPTQNTALVFRPLHIDLSTDIVDKSESTLIILQESYMSQNFRPAKSLPHFIYCFVYTTQSQGAALRPTIVGDLSIIQPPVF